MENDEFSRQLCRLLPQVSVYLRCAMSNIHFAAASLAPAAAREEDPELDKKAALLDQSYYRLLRLVNNLSSAAVMAGEEPLPVRDADMVEVTRDLCAQCDSLAVLLGVEFSFRCGAGVHICAVNRDGLDQILFQLLSNAFKYTPRGGQVLVELKFERGRAFLSVADTGRGIPEEQLEHLFDRYLQTDALPLPPAGLGLGLSICQRIAQRLGGSLLADSREGRGTRVTVSLPDRRCGDAAVEDVAVDYNGGFNPTLLGLADALPAGAFLLRDQE